MAKGTIFFLFFLAIIAVLLFGINIGKKLEKSQVSVMPSPTNYQLQTTNYPTTFPTLSFIPNASNSAVLINGKYVYSNLNCGYEITYPQNWLRLDYDGRSIGLSNTSSSPSSNLAIICAPNIPKPALSADRINEYKIGTISAKLYHDASPKDGSPLDEIIAKIPDKNMEIFIAGFGPTLTEILSSFKFTQ